MRPIKIIVLLAALTVAGCSTSKKASRTQDDTYSSQKSGKSPRILYPKGQEPYASETLGDEDRRDSRPRIRFNDAESAHVRVAGINPLPESGVLAVNLDNLSKEFCYPYRGNFLSDYGMRGQAMHTGIDIKTAPNDTIRAALPGVVRMSKLYSSYGNIVVIRHYCGFETVYAHCSRNLVKVNDVVEAGDPVGLGGRTGRATTEHLHFEVRAAGEHIDPKKLLDTDGKRLHKGMLFFQKLDGDLIAYSSMEELNKIKDSKWDVADNRIPKTPVTLPGGEEPPRQITVKKSPVSDSGKSSGNAGKASSSQYHVVKKGDTLYAISRKYSTTVNKLCQLNGIKENSVLSINQKIRVR